eukprot:CAMPEP_0118655434 /NCGR_PEP_ID=MMETSP0785-20121206/12923_1 /TAXON_ID=91992 /ORGANISM="Bolidomonas pacifica, Strain CCMP 1866" /LENGTH=87 /DNA_ID=CAMNT_0006548165 /DNA_START=744 /DNA_END=1007 /DNA_ORIENTATION=+
MVERWVEVRTGVRLQSGDMRSYAACTSLGDMQYPSNDFFDDPCDVPCDDPCDGSCDDPCDGPCDDPCDGPFNDPFNDPSNEAILHAS